MNKTFRSILQGLMIILATLGLINCSRAPEKPRAATMIASIKPIHRSLHFSGFIQPLQKKPLIIPIEATLEKMHYRYGQWVKKDEIVAVLNSPELQKQYDDNLTEFLKAKENFNMAEARFRGSENLWLAGLIPKNSYLSEKSSIYTARMTLLQSKKKLTALLERTEDPILKKLSTLNMANFAQVQSALNEPHQLIYLKAPLEGMLLYPNKSQEEKNGPLSVGSNVKTGQIFGYIGDLRGVSIDIEVPETDLAHIHANMQATITGIALKNQILQGKLVSINAQASEENTHGLPTFHALIQVDHLSSAQQKLIKVGMSASVELTMEEPGQLIIPIKAIQQQYGKSVVKIKTSTTHYQMQPIITGQAFESEVVVEKGLKPGDVVVLNE